MLVNLIIWCDILLSKKSKSIGPTTVDYYISGIIAKYIQCL
jgi:hypothetical protein